MSLDKFRISLSERVYIKQSAAFGRFCFRGGVYMADVEIIQPLTQREQRDYELYKGRIRLSFRDAIDAIQHIRDERLYRVEYATFEEFCKTELEQSYRHINRLIVAADVSDDLGPIGPKLLESQARVLAQLEEPDDRRLAFEVAAMTSPDGRITAKRLQSTVNVLKQAKATGGYVDVGNGTMSALAAAVDQETNERIKRQNQHIADSSKWERVATVETAAENLRGIEQLSESMADIDDAEIVKVSVYKPKET